MFSSLTLRIRLIVFGCIIILAGVIWFAFLRPAPVVVPEEVMVETPMPVHKTIGTSVEGRDIDAYTYGTGETHILFVGGMHGGYEWNSVLLAYEFMDYVDAHPEVVPTSVSLTIIPSLNPDGVFEVTRKIGRFSAHDVSTDQQILEHARFNAHTVDLNRNFDCKWAPESTWRGATVSAGTAAFSEPESQALRSVVQDIHPTAVVFWHSAAGAVYASECENGILPDTLILTHLYADAAQYDAVEKFDAYPITGDAEGWLASRGIPAITVEFSSHDSIEWTRNLAGIQAVLEHYKK